MTPEQRQLHNERIVTPPRNSPDESANVSRSAEAHPGASAADTLLTIHDLRRIFRLGRTRTYELTRRPGFPTPVPLSARCYRWWASEVLAFATAIRETPSAKPQRIRPSNPSAVPLRITGQARLTRRRTDSR